MQKKELTKEEFELFVNDIQDKDKFLEMCGEFHEIEKRDIIYVISQELLKSNDTLKRLASIDIILMIWNIAWYIKCTKAEKVGLDEDVLSLLNGYKRYDFLNSKNVISINEDDIKAIREIFGLFKEKLGPVGASKSLHMLNPTLFPIWDNEIAHHYHKYKHRRMHKEMSTECYMEFIQDNKGIIKNLLRIRPEEEWWNTHKSSIPQDVLKSFPDFHEKMLKMIDECNYARITERLRRSAHLSSQTPQET